MNRRQWLSIVGGVAASRVLSGCNRNGGKAADAGRGVADAGGSVADAPTGANVDGGPSAIGDAPAWFVNMKNQTWAAIAGGSGYGASYQNGSRIYDVAHALGIDMSYVGNEGPPAIIDDWTGGCANQTAREVYLPAQGGHSGYFNTDIWALNLGADVPAWQRIWAVSPASVEGSELGYNPPSFGNADGSPRTMHGWFHVFCDNKGRLWLTGIDANPSGSWGTNCYSIDRNDLSAGWMYHGRLYPSIPGGSPGSSFGWQAGAGAFDPNAGTRGQIWKRADFYVAKGVVSLDCATAVAAGQQSASTGPQTPGTAYYDNRDVTGAAPAPSVITPDRHWIQLLGAGTPSIEVMDLANPDNLFTKINPSGSATVPEGSGAVWHAASNAVLVYSVPGASGAPSPTIHKLALNGSNPVTASYAWSAVANDASNSVTPSSDRGSQMQGIYSKLQIINDMGNGQSALVVMCGYAGPTFVYKLPALGV